MCFPTFYFCQKTEESVAFLFLHARTHVQFSSSGTALITRARTVLPPPKSLLTHHPRAFPSAA